MPLVTDVKLFADGPMFAAPPGQAATATSGLSGTLTFSE